MKWKNINLLTALGHNKTQYESLHSANNIKLLKHGSALSINLKLKEVEGQTTFQF